MWECCLCGKKTHSVYEINCLFEHNGEKRNICNNCYQLVDKYKQNPHSLQIKEKLNTYYENCDPNVKIYIEEILIREAISKKRNNEYNKIMNNTSLFWTSLLRTVSIINVLCSVIIGFLIWLSMSNYNFKNSDTIGFMLGAGIIIITLIATSGIMVFVEMSENIAKNKENTDKILELLEKKK